MLRYRSINPLNVKNLTFKETAKVDEDEEDDVDEVDEGS